jgi:hypothetical protein
LIATAGVEAGRGAIVMSNSVGSAPVMGRTGGLRPTIPVRVWATPLTIAAFILMAVTGVLMFFGWRRGLTSEVHEWFSWLFLAGAFGHIFANIRPFTSHLKSRWGRISIAATVVLLTVCILPFHGPHQLRGVVQQSVRDAPLSTLASLANVAPEDLQNRLKAHGISATMNQSVRQLADQNRYDENRLLAMVFMND